jgi:uncharacterized protein YdhG (YjbR/CyaY superfamily)
MYFYSNAYQNKRRSEDMLERKKYDTIDEYISSFPKDVQKKLKEIRELVKKEAPHAEEKISYMMPAFYLEGILLYFAGYDRHIGFYPLPSGLNAFKEEISKYKNSKGAVQFPLDKPLPLPLIRKIVKFRIKENLSKAKKSAPAKKKSK